MDEIQLFQLIAEGENERIDFKRMLDLDSAAGKAEFVKDVISLANSAPDTGYMLIGVENNGTIVGAGKLEEERIQQIANTYIDPPVMLRCSVIPASNLLTANVIEIKAMQRPHKTVRAIDRLNQNDVFVRHGSVVVKASPDEIIGLSRAAQAFVDVQPYVRAAVRHVELGNVDNALKAYSAAIDLAPTAELFLARGRVHLRSLRERPPSADPDNASLMSAYKDFSDAIRLSVSEELSRNARLGRARLYTMQSRNDFDEITWRQDIEWLSKHTQGQELGETLFLELIDTDSQMLLAQHAFEAITRLDYILQLDYKDPDVYSHRAWINCYHLCNYGLALDDINRALEASERHSDYDFVLKGHILLKMGRFKEARLSFVEGRKIGKWRICPYDHGWTVSSTVEMELLQNRSLQQEFYYGTETGHLLLKDILRIAAFNQRYELRDLIEEGSLAADLIYAIGVDFWSQLSNMSGFVTKWYDENQQQLPIS